MIETDLNRRTGAIVFSSSRGEEYSYELERLKNGAFTSGLKDALILGAADHDRNGAVSTDELRSHVRDAVSRLTGGLQHPTVDRDNRHVRFGLPVLHGPLAPERAPRQPHGCGCRTGRGSDATAPVLLALAMGLLWIMKRCFA